MLDTAASIYLSIYFPQGLIIVIQHLPRVSALFLLLNEMDFITNQMYVPEIKSMHQKIPWWGVFNSMFFFLFFIKAFLLICNNNIMAAFKKQS